MCGDQFSQGATLYIPTAVSEREAERLRHYAKGKEVVEAGSLLGYSTIQLATTGKHVHAIDRHTGYDKLPNNTLHSFLRNMEVAGVSKKVTAVVGDFKLLQHYPAGFAFIDLCGTFAVTLEAIRAARAPLVAVHDFQRSNCPGVEMAVRASKLRVVERVDSLIVLEKSAPVLAGADKADNPHSSRLQSAG